MSRVWGSCNILESPTVISTDSLLEPADIQPFLHWVSFEHVHIEFHQLLAGVNSSRLRQPALGSVHLFSARIFGNVAFSENDSQVVIFAHDHC